MAWQANQLSREGVSGSVLSSYGRKARMTTVQTMGTFEMEGSISRSNLVLAIGVDYSVPGLFYRSTIGTGSVAMIQPGESIYALNRNGLTYMSIDVSPETLMEELERDGAAFDEADLQASGVMEGRIADDWMREIRRCVAAQHMGDAPFLPPGYDLEQIVLGGITGLIARRNGISRDPTPRSYARIVAKAREYVDEHISRPIALDEL